MKKIWIEINHYSIMFQPFQIFAQMYYKIYKIKCLPLLTFLNTLWKGFSFFSPGMSKSKPPRLYNPISQIDHILYSKSPSSFMTFEKLYSPCVSERST